MHLPGQEGSEEWRLWWAHSQGPGIWVTMETGPRVTTNMGWNFSFRSQPLRNGKVGGSFFSFERVIGGGGAWKWGEAGARSFMFPVKIPYPTPAPRPGNQILAEIIFTLFSLFIARCIPPRIPLGSKVTPEGCQDTARSLSYAIRPQHNDICPMNTVILSSLGTWEHPSTPTHNSPAAGVARVPMTDGEREVREPRSSKTWGHSAPAQAFLFSSSHHACLLVLGKNKWLQSSAFLGSKAFYYDQGTNVT